MKPPMCSLTLLSCYFFLLLAQWASLVTQMVKNPGDLQCKRPGLDPWVGKIPWRRERLPTLVFLPGESSWKRSLAGYSLWGREESDTTERLSTALVQCSVSFPSAHPPGSHTVLLPRRCPLQASSSTGLGGSEALEGLGSAGVG